MEDGFLMEYNSEMYDMYESYPGYNRVIWSSEGSCETCTGSSSGGMSEPEGLEIPVWIGGCEKWVTGLTKRTTCDDVIYALLCHNSNPHQVEALGVQNFAIHERWRDMERPLRGRTKILKVWRAWGTESGNVRFFMRKVENVLDESCEVSSIKSYTRKPRRESSHRHHGNNHGNQNIHHSNHHHRDRGERRHSRRDREGRHGNHGIGNHSNGHRNSSRRSRDAAATAGSHGNRDSSLPPRADPSSHRRDLERQPRSLSQDRVRSGNPGNLDITASELYPPGNHSNHGHSSHSNAKHGNHGRNVTKSGKGNTTNKTSVVSNHGNNKDGRHGNNKDSKDTQGDIKDGEKSAAFHQLVSVILEQERKLQELQERLLATDREIETHETRIHVLRMRKNGRDYVQEAYLRERSDESSASSEELFPRVRSGEMGEYIRVCEEILGLQDRIGEQESRIEELSTSVLEERDPLLSSTPRTRHAHPEPEVSVTERISELSAEIDRCARIQEVQVEEGETLERSVRECEQQLQLKMDYMCKLQCEIEQAGVSDTEEGEGEGVPPVVQFSPDTHDPSPSPPPRGHPNGLIQPPPLTKPRGILKDTGYTGSGVPYQPPLVDGTGKSMIPYCTYTTYTDGYQNQTPGGTKHNVSDDSDTGLSSLHSDDPPPQLETLV